MKRKLLTTTAVCAALAASNVAVAQQQTRSDTASKGKVVTANPDYSKSMRELQGAAQRLRESIQALAQQQPGPQREQALAAAHRALFDTQQAMIQLPPELRNAPAPVGVADAQGTSSAKAGKGQTQARGGGGSQAPLLVLFPPVVVAAESFADGCWARLYEHGNFQGDFLTIAGPGDFAYMRTSLGNVTRTWDSVAVGPKATLQAYDNENFTQRVAIFKSGQRVPDLDEKLGFFENIRSSKISCSK